MNYIDPNITRELRKEPCEKQNNSPYKTDRAKTWRNLLVAAINEGIHRGIFSLEWPHEDQLENGEAMFNFEWHGGYGTCVVQDLGHDELGINVGWNTHPNNCWRGMPPEPMDYPCRAYGSLERHDGFWLQDGSRQYQTKLPVKFQRLLADAHIEPLGYEDNGKFMW
jgi:hypothetical protein